MPRPRLALQVIEKAALAEGITGFTLVASPGERLPGFTPGAHVEVVTPGGHVRKYSLSGDPADADRWTLGVKREGEGSSDLIDWVEAGDTLEVSAPENAFAPPPGDAPLLLIAGGIGITPLRSMLLAARRDRRAARLVYLTRSREHAAYAGTFDGAADVVAHHDGGDPARAFDLAGLLAEPAGRIVMCCGPRPLMEAVRALTASWPAGSVRFEDFGRAAAANATRDRAFVARLARTGRVVEVPVGQSLMAALRAAGVDLPSSCESGSCGTCRTGLLSGDAEHRDLVLSDAERATAIMPCVSRARGGELVLDL